jgi:hypothetical protein
MTKLAWKQDQFQSRHTQNKTDWKVKFFTGVNTKELSPFQFNMKNLRYFWVDTANWLDSSQSTVFLSMNLLFVWSFTITDNFFRRCDRIIYILSGSRQRSLMMAHYDFIRSSCDKHTSLLSIQESKDWSRSSWIIQDFLRE